VTWNSNVRPVAFSFAVTTPAGEPIAVTMQHAARWTCACNGCPIVSIVIAMAKAIFSERFMLVSPVQSYDP
jgi:hypothetical protein